MKKIVFAIILGLAIILSGSLLSLADSGGSSGGTREDQIRIGPAIRLVLQDYLAKEYQHNCPVEKGKNLSGPCHMAVPIYTSETLPPNVGSKDLPAELQKKIGFAPPGTFYKQIGYTVYLIGWPRKIIYDSVTLEDKSQLPPNK